jgi:hypothetical protein
VACARRCCGICAAVRYLAAAVSFDDPLQERQGLRRCDGAQAEAAYRFGTQGGELRAGPAVRDAAVVEVDDLVGEAAQEVEPVLGHDDGFAQRFEP